MMRPYVLWPLCHALVFWSAVAESQQVITVTTHVSACSAIYPSRSTVVVASTMTVTPEAWTDAMPNSGDPFVIRLQQVDTSGYPDQTSAPYWLRSNGNTTVDASLATIYRIVSGRLFVAADGGSYISTDYGVIGQTFAVASRLGAIWSDFSVNKHMLNWTNTNFSNGTAQFYKLPPNLLENAQILVKFIGPMEAQRSWSPVILYVDPRKFHFSEEDEIQCSF